MGGIAISTYTRIVYHIVFGTKGRVPALTAEHRRDFLAYATGTLRGMDSHVYRINCVEDHLHVLTTIPSSMSLSNFVGEFKTSTGKWLRGHGGFPHFSYWQEGYGGFTESWSRRDGLIEYIKGQEEHHRKESFLDEFRRLVEEAGLEWDDRYLP